MSMGCVLARAQQIREQTPQWPARLFAQVSPQDTPMMAFYMESGFDANDALDVVALGVQMPVPPPPWATTWAMCHERPAERQAFLMRMNTYRLDAWSPRCFSGI